MFLRQSIQSAEREAQQPPKTVSLDYKRKYTMFDPAKRISYKSVAGNGLSVEDISFVLSLFTPINVDKGYIILIEKPAYAGTDGTCNKAVYSYYRFSKGEITGTFDGVLIKPLDEFGYEVRGYLLEGETYESRSWIINERQEQELNACLKTLASTTNHKASDVGRACSSLRKIQLPHSGNLYPDKLHLIPHAVINKGLCFIL